MQRFVPRISLSMFVDDSLTKIDIEFRSRKSHDLTEDIEQVIFRMITNLILYIKFELIGYVI